jgi:hypothetical protein
MDGKKSSKIAKRVTMPSGSKPGERRGGRGRGTQNKKTLLKNAAINAAAKSNLSPLELLLTLMRQRDLPLQLRVTVAQQALPFAHCKPKAQIRIKRGYKQYPTDVNEKIGPRVKVAKVNADDPNNVDAHVMPLDFLLGVMRDAQTPPSISLRAAIIVAPFVHSKGEPYQLDNASGEIIVVEDPYGFDADIGDRLKSMHQDEEQLRSLGHSIPRPSMDRQNLDSYLAAWEKLRQTKEYLALEKNIAEQKAALKCPPTYRELDSRQDRARLKELEGDSKIRSITPAEEIEQRYLESRLEVYSLTKEATDCRRMNVLRATGKEFLRLEEKLELEKLETLYPGVPLDPLIDEGAVLARRAINQLLLHRERE